MRRKTQTDHFQYLEIVLDGKVINRSTWHLNTFRHEKPKDTIYMLKELIKILEEEQPGQLNLSL